MRRRSDTPPEPHVYRHGRRWYCKFRIAERVFSLACGTAEKDSEGEARDAAKALVARAFAQFESSRRRRPVNPLDLYQTSIRDRSYAHQENVIRYRQRLVDFFGRRRDLRSLTKQDIEQWRDWLLTGAKRRDRRGGLGLSPKSVKEHLDWLSTVFAYAEIPNPCRKVERPRRSEAERQESLEFFTPDEMRRLFSVCQSEMPRFYNCFVLLAYTGCRADEIRGLRPEDLDADRRAVWVIGKGGSRRQLMLAGPMAPAWTALLAEMKARPRRDGFVFPQGPTWFWKSVECLARKAFGVVQVEQGGKVIERAVRHGHPHMLRHTFATMALLHFSPTWDIARLAKWLGHRDVNTTYRIYGHMVGAVPPSGYVLDTPQNCGQSVDRAEVETVNA